MFLTLEPKFYLDSEIYSTERERLQMRSWQFAGHSSLCRGVGDYFTFEIAGQNLFCIRGRDDKIRAFYNVCQHRAHELVSGVGNCKSAIVCPYHAWSYELDGKFRGGDNVKVIEDFDKDSVYLQEVLCEDFLGFLFVNLDLSARPMDDLFPQVREELGCYVPHILDLAPMRWLEVEEQCNWKISVENYSECYHCALNHKTFSSGVVKPETYNIRAQGYCLRHTTECQNLDSMTYEIDLSSNAYAGKYSSWFLWPMFSFQVYPGNILNTYHWRPLGVDRVNVVRGWYSLGGAQDDVIMDLSVQDRETTFAEDILLVESVHRGLGSRGYRVGPLVVDPNEGVRSEHSIRSLQDWTREALGL